MLEVPDLDHWIEEYRGGMSLKQISDRTGVPRVRLVRRFRERGVEIRGRSDAERLKWTGLKRDPTIVQRQLGAAWTARRGNTDPLERKVRRAITRMQRLTHRFAHEDAIADILRARGIRVQQQQAVGPYNVDLALDKTGIAVEVVESEMVAKRRDGFPKRLKYILDQGWCLVVLSVRGKQAIDYAAICDQLVTLANRAGRTKALAGQHRVIGRHGKTLPRSRYYLDGWPRVD